MVIRWDAKVNSFLNLVQLTGTISGDECPEIASRVLLRDTLEVVKTSKEYEGKLIPLSIAPTKKDENFIYFEIIFKSVSDCTSFLESI